MGYTAVVPLLALHTRRQLQVRKRTIAAIEAVTVFSVIIWQIWFCLNKSTMGVLAADIAVVTIVFLGWGARGETGAAIGIWKTWLVVLPIAFVAIKVVVDYHHAFQHPPMAVKVIGYSGWALVQEILLNAFFAIRLQDCFVSPGRTSFATGAIFGACHIPNPVLTPVTLGWGILASYLFIRMREKHAWLVYPLMIVHAAGGALLMIYLPHWFPAWHHPLAVGPGFYRQ